MKREQVFAILLVVVVIGIVIMIIGTVTPNTTANVVGVLFTGISFLMSLIQLFYQTPIIFGSSPQAPLLIPVPALFPRFQSFQRTVRDTLMYLLYIAPFAIASAMIRTLLTMLLGLLLSLYCFRFVLHLQAVSSSSQPSEVRIILGFFRFVIAVVIAFFVCGYIYLSLHINTSIPSALLILLTSLLITVPIDIYFSRKMYP